VAKIQRIFDGVVKKINKMVAEAPEATIFIF